MQLFEEIMTTNTLDLPRGIVHPVPLCCAVSTRVGCAALARARANRAGPESLLPHPSLH
jgi:hypothetical protein